MVDVKAIESRLYQVVGFQQPGNPDYAIIDTDNQASRSGYFATDNPFVKVEYLKDNSDFSDETDEQFNEHLKRLQQSSIANVANLVFNEVDYIDRNLLYRFASNKTTPLDLPVGFVGYRIEVEDKKNIAFKITRCLLEFDGAGDIELLLFNTAVKEPIQSETVTIAESQQQVELNWVINNNGDYYKGDYYLGYINDGLLVKPFERNYNNANIRSIYSYLCITPIAVTNHVVRELWDLENYDGLYDYTGVNPDITVYEDYTDLMIQNEHLFAQAINMDLQIHCMSTYLASLRSNRNERKSDEKTLQIMIQLNGNDQEGMVKVVGLKTQLARSISHIKKEIKKLKEGYFGGRIFTETLS